MSFHQRSFFSTTMLVPVGVLCRAGGSRYRSSRVIKEIQRSSLEHIASGNTKTNTWTRVSKQFTKPMPLTERLSSSVLPVNYRHSVRPEYTAYTSFMFMATTAGSASMTLGTAALLQATVGGTLVTAGVTTWMLKNLGNLAGVAWTHLNAETYDRHPKAWKVTSALIWDLAALLEIGLPALAWVGHDTWNIFIVGTVTTGLKCIVSVTEGASRAKIHQHFALQANLADVTAKTNSQSLIASSIGTCVAVYVQSVIPGTAEARLAAACCVVLIHQLSTQLGLRHVVYDHFNQDRLHKVLQVYLQRSVVATPASVIRPWTYPKLPLWQQPAWLIIGSSLESHGIKPLDVPKSCKFVLSQLQSGDVHLTFRSDATPSDLIHGILQAEQLHSDSSGECVAIDRLVREMKNAGWNIELTDVEPKDAVRFEFSEREGTEA